jgi:lipopolysaccharide biosynthesis glycosyltransferase
MSETINIALCGNKNAYKHMPVLIQSVLSNTKEDVKFFIFYTDPIDDESMIQMEKFLDKISLYRVNKEAIKFKVPENPPEYWKHIPPEAYIRIIIPKILHGVKKILYLDNDIILEGDVKEVWSFDLNDKLIGMSLEPYPEYSFVGDRETQFQSGVMLMDLEGLREAKFEETLLEYVKNNGDTFDQPLLNGAYSNHIATLPIFFNFSALSVSFFGKIYIDDDEFISEMFGREFLNRIILFHYSGDMGKAWDNPDSRYYKYKSILESKDTEERQT